jgi:hypothetical protein
MQKGEVWKLQRRNEFVERILRSTTKTQARWIEMSVGLNDCVYAVNRLAIRSYFISENARFFVAGKGTVIIPVQRGKNRDSGN